MAGTHEGALKTSKIVKEKYGEDFFGVIGSKGGKAKVPKGFAVSGKGSEAGRVGGARSSRKTELTKKEIRELKKLRSKEHLTWHEIADRMGYSYNVVRNRYIENVHNYVRYER